MSYTDFSYGDVALSGDTLGDGGKVTASVKVTNTGSRAGTETVQFYIRDLRGSVARPVKELRHFERVSLQPGESRTVEYSISEDDLKFYDYDLRHVAEPGDFEVMAGPDSQRTSSAKFTLRK